MWWRWRHNTLFMYLFFQKWLEDTFGVTLIPEVPSKGELWSDEAMKLAVEHESEGFLGKSYPYLSLTNSLSKGMMRSVKITEWVIICCCDL